MNRVKGHLKRAALKVLLCAAVVASCLASTDTQDSDLAGNLADKSIEELMNIDVTSVSRKEQKLSRVPSAVFVITQDDIQRSGVTTVPDALRMAPGVQVLQIDANRWAVSVRGFSDTYSNKLLVLVDGRTVYTPTFSGVLWDQLDVPLDTIDRIEVVRGPGGTVWGANAVNGVINIITKSAREMQGLRIIAGTGTTQTGNYAIRYGGAAGPNISYRLYGGRSSYADLPASRTGWGNDNWSANRAGGRVDWRLGASDSITLDGGTFRNAGWQRLGAAVIRDDRFSGSGSHASASWNHSLADGSQFSLSLYDTAFDREDASSHIRSNLFDLNFQHHVKAKRVHDVVWGAGFRTSTDVSSAQRGSNAPFFIAFRPASLTQKLLSGFVQDEIALSDSLSLTLGTKVEHSAFLAADFQPNVRLAWLPSDSQTLWVAASKATRLPAHVDTSVDEQSANISMPGFELGNILTGNPGLRPESLREYEAGYRIVPANNLSFDLTAFRGFYHDLVSIEAMPPAVAFSNGVLNAQLPFTYGNSARATTGGLEADVNWKVLPRWRLGGSYSWLRMNARYLSGASSDEPAQALFLDSLLGPGAYSMYLSSLIKNAPAADPTVWSAEHQVTLRSYFDLTSRLIFDNSFYYASPMELPGIPALRRLDTHLGWKVTRHITASITGQNLLTPRHFESNAVNLVTSTQVPRAFLGRLEWAF